ncbi:MAG: LysR family transcriptional regulator [Clostridia bacterium]|nr:LysR family transcriptional regulator [Clostridia bacterium]
MYFHEMKYVFEVYKYRSFSKAAQALSIAQPTLSLMIKKAETRLGGALFDRTKNPLVPTDLCRAYVQAAKGIMCIEENFEQYIQANEQCPSGTLTLGGTPLFVSYMLPPLLAAFSERYPGVDIRLHEHPSYMLENDLKNGVLDLAMDNASLNPELFNRHVCQPEEVILAVPGKIAESAALRLYRMTSSYIQRGGLQGAAAVSLKLLSDVPFILLRKDSDTRRRSDKLCQEAGFEPKVRLEVDQQITAYNMASAGLGAAFISDTLIDALPHSNHLMFFRLSGENARRDICFFYRKDTPLSAPAEAFLKMFEHYKPSVVE